MGLSETLHGLRPDRRSLLRGALTGSAGLAAAALLGCKTSETKPEAPAAAAPAGGSSAAKVKYINESYLAFNDPKTPLPYVLAEEDLAPKSGGTFRMATQYDIASFDPTNATSNTSIAVTCSVAESLLALKHGPASHPVIGEIVPRLAKSWEVSPDGTTITFRLNSGVKFQNIAPVNGRPFTADDVRLVYERYQKEGVSRALFSNVDSMKAIDPATFQVKLKKPQPDFLSPLATRILPIYAIELVDSGDLKRGSKTVGTGAYQLKDAIRGEKISYVRNPDYYGKPGYLEGAEWRIIIDEAARLAALRAGQADFSDTPYRGFDISLKFHQTGPEYKMEMPPPIGGNVGFALNLKNPKFQDDRVRQGLALLLDRKRYLDTTNQGWGTPQLPMIPWNYVFDQIPTQEQVGPFRKFDPAEGKKLLAAAGQDKMTLDSVNYYQTDQTVGFYVNALKEQGIALNNKNLDLVSFSSQWQQTNYAEVAGGTATGANFYADIYFKDMILTNSGGNRWNLSDPEIDEWGNAQSTEVDPKKRRELLKKIWDKIETKAYRPLETPQTTGAALPWHPYIMGWRPTRASGAITPAADCGTYLQDMWFNK